MISLLEANTNVEVQREGSGVLVRFDLSFRAGRGDGIEKPKPELSQPFPRIADLTLADLFLILVRSVSGGLRPCVEPGRLSARCPLIFFSLGFVLRIKGDGGPQPSSSLTPSRGKVVRGQARQPLKAACSLQEKQRPPKWCGASQLRTPATSLRSEGPGKTAAQGSVQPACEAASSQVVCRISASDAGHLSKKSGAWQGGRSRQRAAYSRSGVHPSGVAHLSFGRRPPL